MIPHRIRLHGPWRISISKAQALGSSPPSERIQIPQDWDHVNLIDSDCIILNRPFGCPSRLDPSQNVRLLIRCDSLVAKVRLNEVLIGQIRENDRDCRIEIRDSLISRNCLQLELSPTSLPISLRDKDSQSYSPWGKLTDVQLEIDQPPLAE